MTEYYEGTRYNRIVIGKSGNEQYGIEPDEQRSDSAVAYVTASSPYRCKGIGEPEIIDSQFQECG